MRLIDYLLLAIVAVCRHRVARLAPRHEKGRLLRQRLHR